MAVKEVHPFRYYPDFPEGSPKQVAQVLAGLLNFADHAYYYTRPLADPEFPARVEVYSDLDGCRPSAHNPQDALFMVGRYFYPYRDRPNKYYPSESFRVDSSLVMTQDELDQVSITLANRPSVRARQALAEIAGRGVDIVVRRIIGF